MKMKLYWKVYFIFAFLYKIGMLVYSSLTVEYDVNITDLFYAVFFLGVFGLAFNIRILNEKIWRCVFVFAAIVYIHAWILMPAIYVFSEGVSILKVLFIMMFSVPLIPLIYGLYIYAWLSNSLWFRGDVVKS